METEWKSTLQIVHHGQAGFTSECKDGSTCIINVIQNRLKDGNRMVTSMDEGKIFDKVQHSLQAKMTEEAHKGRNVFGLNKKTTLC